MSELQFLYLFLGIVATFLTVIGTARHAERRNEKRLVRIETFLVMCCHKLNIQIDDMNKL